MDGPFFALSGKLDEDAKINVPSGIGKAFKLTTFKLMLPRK